jgi:hypothetical protein
MNGKETAYRGVRETDRLEPGKVILTRPVHRVRKLREGDPVRRGQLLALVNPCKMLDDVAGRLVKLKGAEADRLAAHKKAAEYEARYRRQVRLNQLTPGSVSPEEVAAALLQRDTFAQEERAKAARVEECQHELSAGFTDLKRHEIRAAIDGTIKFIYKNSEGDAVKPLEAILQIQNPRRLRLEGLLDVQEALQLKPGLPVLVEASRPESPRLVLGGHLGAVTCVAVGKGSRSVIVSGSEDGTLRGWDAATGACLWVKGGLKSAVRAVACTPPGSRHNLALLGCADGTARLLDLDRADRRQGARGLGQCHRGSINGVAFSPDGQRCATCGDDRTIRLWETATGALLSCLSAAHRNDITSVRFISDSRLLSAGRDNRLVVWDVEPGKPPVPVGPDFEGRSGDVAQVGVSPDGQTVLFDQGRELSLLSLADKEIRGSLENPAVATSFSTLALFAPDGRTILTNGPAPGSLRLWRTPSGAARASELRQLVWAKGAATCGAFARWLSGIARWLSGRKCQAPG